MYQGQHKQALPRPGLHRTLKSLLPCELAFLAGQPTCLPRDALAFTCKCGTPIAAWDPEYALAPPWVAGGHQQARVGQASSAMTASWMFFAAHSDAAECQPPANPTAPRYATLLPPGTLPQESSFARAMLLAPLAQRTPEATSSVPWTRACAGSTSPPFTPPRLCTTSIIVYGGPRRSRNG
jgi:hypothetical protein